MSIDGVERAPLVTDYDRWRRLTFDVPTRMAFHRMDDTFVPFNSKIDVNAKSIVLTRAGNDKWSSTFSFDRPSPDRMTLDGEMDGKKVRHAPRAAAARELPARHSRLQLDPGISVQSMNKEWRMTSVDNE